MNHFFNWERELAKYYTIREVETRNTELPPRSIVCEACHKECKPFAVLYIYGNECMNQPNIRLTARTAIELSKPNQLGKIMSQNEPRHGPLPEREKTDLDG